MAALLKEADMMELMNRMAEEWAEGLKKMGSGFTKAAINADDFSKAICSTKKLSKTIYVGINGKLEIEETKEPSIKEASVRIGSLDNIRNKLRRKPE